MKSIIAIFVTLLLVAISATALAMPSTSGAPHDSQHLMRLLIAQNEAAQDRWV